MFDILSQPGVTNCHVTVELNCENGSLSVEFTGPIAASSERKGWDGCIYGPDRPVKKPTSRVTLIPPVAPGQPPITELYLYPAAGRRCRSRNPPSPPGGADGGATAT